MAGRCRWSPSAPPSRRPASARKRRARAPAACSRRAALDWDDFTRELDLWAADGRVAAFWWRDDDAEQDGPALSRLLDLAEETGIEVGVAVVPAMAGSGLAEGLAGRTGLRVLQHGYRHRNHAAAGAGAIECGGDRPAGAVIAELQLGCRRLAALFGTRFAPVLAAPWNRIDTPVLAALPDAGFLGASAIGPRRDWGEVPGLAMANIHVDPLSWRGGARFAGSDKALRSIVHELQARRTGVSDPDEPLGVLTHHRDHDEATWDFLHRLFAVTSAHTAARWLSVAEVFALTSGAAALQAGGA